MTIPLATAPVREHIETLRARLMDRACVIVGSAPLRTKTAEILPGELRIAVNGSLSSLPEKQADLWVLNSKAQDRPGSPTLHEMHRLMLVQATGGVTDHLLLLRGPKVASEQETLEALRQREARWQTWSVLDKPTKRWFEGEVCARVDEKAPCSAGILATAIALWCGAASVRLIGFSLKPGYHYLPKVQPQRWWRNHVEADQRAMRALVTRYPGRVSGAMVPTDLAVAS